MQNKVELLLARVAELEDRVAELQKPKTIIEIINTISEAIFPTPKSK